MAAKQIFRQAAVQRLSLADGLDEPRSIILPRVWLGVLAILAGVVGLVAWALASTAPVKVSAHGLLLPERGLQEISVLEGGRVASVDVRLGAVIEPGTVIASFVRDDRRREAVQLEQQTDDVEDRLQTLQAFFAEENAIEDEAIAAQLATIDESLQLTQRRLQLLQEREENVRELVARRIVTSDEMLAIELEIAQSTERLSALRNQARTIEIAAAERRRAQRLRILDDTLEYNQLSRQLVRLQADISDETVVRSAHAGRVAELRVALGDVVTPGTSILTLSPIGMDDAQAIAVVYVPSANGRRIATGMEAELVPAAFKRAQFGFIRGQVVSVAPVASTREGMLQTVRNEAFVDQLLSGGAVFEVRVALETDSSTPSGLTWSSSEGPPSPVLPGTPLDVQIVIERKPIADMVVPGLSSTLAL
ncbi:MAG: NHLP bacteriocin system secretion protein [Pseudomonadota bacterium]